MIKRFNGFTLIELLVVVAIIAVLVALLLPSLSQARKTAISAACGSNLHQIVLAFQCYNDDNTEFYPPHWGSGAWIWSDGSTAAMWSGFLAVYLGWDGNTDDQSFQPLPVFRCPGDTFSGFMTYESTVANAYNYSYGYNFSAFSSQNGFGKARRSEVESPEWKVLLADSQAPSPSGSPGGMYIVHPDIANGWLVSNRHSDTNVLFADGHVTRKTIKELHGTEMTAWTPLWQSTVYYRFWYPY